eukprot:TRINITY_DN7186_c0_g1_i1.p1 TRINITY_DN7186_c0_g1~~TRINITY_DN7186_c0_g1_i1.p1  ORF type:complete len:298 (+),score=44.52 TRINITY_DN7186_c0_g1_i1:25-894(+)
MAVDQQKSSVRAIGINLLAGSFSGIASTSVCHPLDTLRTRLQASQAGQYAGVLDCFRQTVKNEGFLALYQGLSAPLAAQAVYKAVIFGTNSVVKPLLPATESRYTEVFTSGVISGGVNSFVVTPVELIRNRLMVQNRSSGARAGPTDVVKRVLLQDGVVGLWRGMVPTLMRDGPGVGCWFVGFEIAKDTFRKFSSDPAQPLPFWKVFASGSFGGACFWAVALPVDTVKSVYQIQENRKSVLAVARQLISERGLFYLFRAWPVAFGRGIPGAAVTLTSYDFALQYLNKNF